MISSQTSSRTAASSPRTTPQMFANEHNADICASPVPLNAPYAILSIIVASFGTTFTVNAFDFVHICPRASKTLDRRLLSPVSKNSVNMSHIFSTSPSSASIVAPATRPHIPILIARTAGSVSVCFVMRSNASATPRDVKRLTAAGYFSAKSARFSSATHDASSSCLSRSISATKRSMYPELNTDCAISSPNFMRSCKMQTPRARGTISSSVNTSRLTASITDCVHSGIRVHIANNALRAFSDEVNVSSLNSNIKDASHVSTRALNPSNDRAFSKSICTSAHVISRTRACGYLNPPST
mmetsp:Transcript_4530/g.15015  ORF Transcript_4530/g.15015 Transcript_4530/m.15015 type:complete len:298 (+) Transcript_4530:432-1325(+)